MAVATSKPQPFSLRSLLVVLGLIVPLAGSAQGIAPAKAQVMVVGTDHLNQLYNKQPQSDVFSPKKQQELAQVRTQLARFRPDIVLIEAEPKEQGQIDSLYACTACIGRGFCNWSSFRVVVVSGTR